MALMEAQNMQIYHCGATLLRMVLLIAVVVPAASAQEEGPKRMSKCEKRLDSETQTKDVEKTLVRSVLQLYPSLQVVSGNVVPRHDMIAVRSVDDVPGGGCFLIRVRRPEHLFEIGTWASVLEDTWGVYENGCFQKLGSGPFPMLSNVNLYFHDLDAQVVNAFASQCLAQLDRDSLQRFYIAVSLPCLGFLWKPDASVSPTWRYVDSKNELPLSEGPELESAWRIIEEVRTKRYVAELTEELSETRCVAFTNTRPAWARWGLVCWGFVFSERGTLVHAEVLEFKRFSQSRF